MIPGWRDMEYEEKMEAIQSLGVGPEEMWAQLNKKKSVKNKPPMQVWIKNQLENNLMT